LSTATFCLLSQVARVVFAFLLVKHVKVLQSHVAMRVSPACKFTSTSSRWCPFVSCRPHQTILKRFMNNYNLTGSLPTTISELANISQLYVLSIAVPQAHIARNSYLNNNRLTGTIPVEIGKCTSLREMYARQFSASEDCLLTRFLSLGTVASMQIA
jgi:hypothetical protein